MKIAVVTDSTAYLSPKQIEKYNIHIVPMPVIIDGKTYREGVDLTTDQFYDKLRTSDSFPSTSQPAVGELVQMYENLGDQGYDVVISIHLAATISGLYNTLKTIVAPQVKNIKVIPFDSKITSMPMGNMVQKALEMKDAGKSIEEILDYLDYIRSNTRAFLIVDDLNNLVRGGRLTNGAAIIGGLLKIKPILTFEDGKIVLHEKIRSSKKAFAKAEELVFESAQQCPGKVKYYVIHANNLEVAKEEKVKLEAQFPDIQVEIGYFGPVIGTHLGEKAIGLAFSAE